MPPVGDLAFRHGVKMKIIFSPGVVDYAKNLALRGKAIEYRQCHFARVAMVIKGDQKCLRSGHACGVGIPMPSIKFRNLRHFMHILR